MSSPTNNEIRKDLAALHRLNELILESDDCGEWIALFRKLIRDAAAFSPNDPFGGKLTPDEVKQCLADGYATQHKSSQARRALG